MIEFSPDSSYVVVEYDEYDDHVRWVFGREEGNYKRLNIFEREGHWIWRIKCNPDGSCVVVEYDDYACFLWKRIPKSLLKGLLTLKQHLFISLLLNNKKNGQPTSLALLAKHLQANGLNIILAELEDIFFSFNLESQVFLAKYFDIVEYKVYKKFRSLDPEFNFDKQCFIQILRQYRIEHPKQVKADGVKLFDLDKFVQDSKLSKICNRNIGNFDVRKIFESFSEEAQEFLKCRYFEKEKSKCVVS